MDLLGRSQKFAGAGQQIERPAKPSSTWRIVGPVRYLRQLWALRLSVPVVKSGWLGVRHGRGAIRPPKALGRDHHAAPLRIQHSRRTSWRQRATPAAPRADDHRGALGAHR